MKPLLIILICFSFSKAKEIPQLLVKPTITRVTEESVQFEYGKNGGGKVADDVECAGFVLDGNTTVESSTWEIGSRSAEFSGLTPDTEYQIAVKCRSVGEQDDGTFSPVANIRTYCKYPDDSSIWPRNVAISDITASRGIVRWEIPSHRELGCTLQKFLVSHRLKEDSDTGGHVKVDGSCEKYVLTGLQKNTEYVLEVSVIAEQQIIGTAASVDFKTSNSVVGPVNAPQTSNTTSRTTLFSWEKPYSAVNSVVNYFVHVTLKEVLQCIKLTLTEENRTQDYKTDQISMTLKDLRPNSKYDLFIEAQTKSAWSDGSKLSITTAEDAPDGAPENLQVNAMPPTNWTFQWDKISCYLVNGIVIFYEYAVTKDEAWNLNPKEWYIEPTVIQETQVTLTDFADDSDYNFFVRGRTNNGSGPWANVVVEATRKKPVEFYPPQDIKITHVSSTDVEFIWKKPKSTRQPVLGYKIVYKDVKIGSFFGEKYVNSDNTNKLGLRIENLLPASIYEISVKAVYPMGESTPIFVNCTTMDRKNITTVNVQFPKPPKVHLDAESNTWVVEFYPTSDNNTIKAYQVIVENSLNDQNIQENELQGYGIQSSDVYIIAEIDAKNISSGGYNLTIGDNLVYGGYTNAKLDELSNYRVYVRTVGENNVFSHLMQSADDVTSEPSPETDEPCLIIGLKCLWFGLLLTIIVFIILCIVLLIFCINHRRNKSGSHEIHQSVEVIDESDESRKPSWVGSTRSYSLSYQTLMSQGEIIS